MNHPVQPVAFGCRRLPSIAETPAVPLNDGAAITPTVTAPSKPFAATVERDAPADPKLGTKRKGLLATLLMPLIVAFKLFKLGKIGGTAISMVVMLGVYTLRFGWSYAAGFIALLFVHEMGHYIAAKRRGLNVGTPAFIPFVGAWIELKEQPVDAETEAYVGLAGPLLGSLGAAMCFLLALATGSQMLLAVAYAGFFLNFFNLIPISPLDGGRITAVLTPRIWFVGVPVMLALLFYRPSPLLILIAIMAIPSLKKAWKYDRNAPENRAYYGISKVRKLEYAGFYIALTACLALMTSAVHTKLVDASPHVAAAPVVEAPVSAAGPTTGGMHAWAKLYPGAVVVRNHTQVMFGLTDWRVTFKTSATPEQIGAFYEGLARSEGFTNTDGILGLHRFTQPGTNNSFSYMIFNIGGQPHVVFQARTRA